MIGSYAFENCSALKKVEMPSTVTTIAYKAFYNSGIKEVHYEGSETEWNSISFSNYNTSIKNATIYYGRDTADLTTLFSKSAYEYNHTIAKALKDYINKYSSQEVILWMTSYSRGAAITNLIAGEMDNYADSVNNLKRENIFVYTFATPMPVKVSAVDANNEKYNNIYNIISQTDVVPRVLLSQWGFGRYGVTKSFYSNASQGVKDYYKKLTKQDYPISTEQRDTLSEVIYLMNKLVGDKSEFNKKYQGAVQDIIEWCMVYKNVRGKDKTLLDYATDKYTSSKVQDAYKLSASVVQNYKTALVKVGIKENYIDKIKEIGTIFILNDKGLEATVLTSLLDNIIGLQLGPMLLSGLKIYLDFTDGNVTFGGLKASHTADVYRSWLYSDSDTSKIFIQPYEAPDLSASYGGKYKTQLIHCPVDVTVTDKEGNVVVSVINHEILIDELPTVVTDDKVKIFYYDNFDEYTTTMTAYDDGVVNYYVSEYAGDGTESRRICYTDIAIKADESLVGEVNDEIGTDTSDYDLSLGENNISTTDVIETDNLENLSVTVNVEGSGSVSDIAKASKGDYVTLTAESYVGAEFIGWYKNEEKLSAETTYSFCIEENIELTAKFTLANADIFAITAPIEENETIECDVYVEAIKDVVGKLIFTAYSEDILVDSYSCYVSLSGNNPEKFSASFANEKNIDEITVCLYDMSESAITKELASGVVRGEIPVYEKDGYKYTYITEDTIEIVGLADTSAVSVTVPETIDEKTVVSLSREAFANSSLRDIILPDTLIAIKENGFLNCDNLSKVFYYGSQEDYEHIIVENGNEILENAAVVYEYADTMIEGEITSVSYSNGNIHIGLGLEYCYKDSVARVDVYDELSENIVVSEAVSISDGETEKDIIVPLIADDKVYNFEMVFCDAKNTEIIYENVLDGAVFAEITGYLENDFEYIVDSQGNARITEYSGTDEDVTLPETLNNYNVIGVDCNEFAGNMKTLRIGANIINLENNPFLHCLMLENIIVSEENKIYSSVDGVLFDKTKSELILYPAVRSEDYYLIPEGTRTVKNNAFCNGEVTYLAIPSTLEKFEDLCFNNFLFSYVLYCSDEDAWNNISIGVNEDSEYWDIRYNYNPDFRIDAEIESAVNDKNAVSVELNYNYSYQPHSLCVAVYDEALQLIDIQNDVFYEWNQPENLTFDFDYDEDIVPYKVKVFFLDPANMIKPLRTVLEEEITKR